MELELTTCPECGLPAEVLYRSALQSTAGPVEHVKLQCVTGHWFFTEASAHRPAPRIPAAR
jgi:hypothetical protein